jgi:hypothetical protein
MNRDDREEPFISTHFLSSSHARSLLPQHLHLHPRSLTPRQYLTLVISALFLSAHGLYISPCPTRVLVHPDFARFANHSPCTSVRTTLLRLIGPAPVEIPLRIFPPRPEYHSPLHTMKLVELHAAIGAAALLLLSPCEAKHGHSHQLEHLEAFGKRHNHQDKHNHRRTFSAREDAEGDLSKRTGSCAFPTNVGLVAVTPDQQNAGWAMSPNQPCLPNNYCPYACPPGQIMAQWNPLATSYVYPLSMVGQPVDIKTRRTH